MTIALAPIVFERPVWLFMLLLIVPCFVLALRSIGGLSRVKALVTFGFRCLLIIALAMALAHPSWEKRGEGVTLSILLDRSLSVPYARRQEAIKFLEEATEFRPEPEDRIAVITIGKDATIARLPDVNSKVGEPVEPSDLTATNLAEGINTALAIMPDDTANRIILASDGNETEGSIMEAAELARANGVPVDVVVLRYEHQSEVIFERMIAPARVRRGQSANLKMVLRSQTAAQGTIFLRQNGQPLDLNGADPGEGLSIDIQPGPTVIPLTLNLNRPGPQQFEAFLEVDGDGDLPDNNRAVAVTFVGTEGRVLIVDEDPAETASFIAALREGKLNCDRTTPEGMRGGLVFLSGYDGIILANVPRYSFDDEQVRMLHAYVHDLGGGLVMLGGPNSFGAGGWIDSELSKVLPVKLDPPSVQQMPRGALALIMHSCEMAQGNFWGQKVAESAILALSRLDYVGIVEFNWGGGGGGFRGCSWAFPIQEAGDKQAALQATKQMVVGDMPDFSASMKLALDGLTTRAARAAQRHVIIISDGDPSPPGQPLLDNYKKAKITVTTIMVGGHGTGTDQRNMKWVADQTGGRFYNVTNPKNLPQIFIKEAQLVSRSLIQENDIYTPQVSTLPGPVEGFRTVPQIEGYVLTAPREGLAQIPIKIPTSEGTDPLYAYWNYGLGKSIAFTSDARARWGGQWVAWSDFQAFWEQSIRWVMRPSSPSNITVSTRTEGDLAVVEVEALGADAAFLNLLQTRGVVVSPEGTPESLVLQQIGPGRYRGEFRTPEPGAYLVNINYAGGSADSPTTGNVQAAVSVPYSQEFRSVKHNAALLRQLAEKTNGRVISETNPELVDLFDRTSLEVPRTHRRIWDLLAMIAAGIFILDVAARRLAVDRKWIAGLFGRAVSARGETSEGTVAAWKRARASAAHRRGDDKADAKRRFEAGEDDQGYAIDAGREVPADVQASTGKVKRPAETSEPEPDDGEEGTYTSRLLEAKRRAARGDEESEREDGNQ